eukprot:10965784-Alexandrium_andersonii.AAC.1
MYFGAGLGSGPLTQSVLARIKCPQHRTTSINSLMPKPQKLLTRLIQAFSGIRGQLDSGARHR